MHLENNTGKGGMRINAVWDRGEKMFKSIEQLLFNNKVTVLMRTHDGDLIMGIMFGLSILRISHCVVDPDKEGKALHSRGHRGAELK